MATTTERAYPVLILFSCLLILCLGCLCLGSENQHYIIPSMRREDCKKDIYHEFYDLSHLTCKRCTQNSSIQTVSMDGLSCICKVEYKIVKDFGGGEILCEKCPKGMIASLDGWTCITCSVMPQRHDKDKPGCPACTETSSISVERDLDGAWLNKTNPERKCVPCQRQTLPSPGGERCTRCNIILRSQNNCTCLQDREAGGLCFDRSIEPDHSSLYTLDFESEEGVSSAYFRTHLRAAHAACAPPWSNRTACQLVANLCTLLQYNLRNKPPSTKTCGSTPCNDACSLYFRLTSVDEGNILPSYNISHPNIQEWKENMTWLFYEGTGTSSLLTDTNLPTVYERGDSLNITLAKFDHRGGFLGYRPGKRNTMSLCQSADDLGFNFGTQFTRECYLYVDRILNDTDHSTIFYDPYISFTDEAGIRRLHAIPVLTKNLKDKDGTKVNRGTDSSKWIFVRRYFLLDNIAGREDLENSPKVVQYVKSMELHVSVQKGQYEGKIYVPWLEVEYDEVHQKQYGQSQQVKTVLRVSYGMDLEEHGSDLGIAVGVMSGVAVIFSLFQAYNHNRREGKVAIDFLTLLHLGASLCGTLANAFFIVILGASIWWFLLYKMQQVMFLVPALDGDYYIRAFLGSAFALKTLNIAHLLVSQCTIDMFLLDWERPKDRDADESVESEGRAGQTKVSIWRTYFVANEWNELSTLRRVNMAPLLLLMCLLLQGVGLDNLARLELSGNLHGNTQEEDEVVFSRVMRFAISALVYIGVALILWILNFVKKCLFANDRIEAFRDVCSMCNVSAFLMTHHQYGYYVHGRSVHGYADVGLREMHENLGREEKDLCGCRGLEPGTDHQTFEVALPRRLREEYNKVLLPVKRAKARQKLRTNLDAEADTALLAYDVLNRFLQRFIEHGLGEVDYVITKKNMAERILDTEVEDNRDLGYFYIDEGSSFTRTLLCGNELSLHVFSLLLFTMVDLIGTNFVLAAALTYAADEVIRRARYAFGRRNIASKILVDERLLI